MCCLPSPPCLADPRAAAGVRGVFLIINRLLSVCLISSGPSTVCRFVLWLRMDVLVSIQSVCVLCFVHVVVVLSVWLQNTTFMCHFLSVVTYSAWLLLETEVLTNLAPMRC